MCAPWPHPSRLVPPSLAMLACQRGVAARWTTWGHGAHRVRPWASFVRLASSLTNVDPRTAMPPSRARDAGPLAHYAMSSVVGILGTSDTPPDALNVTSSCGHQFKSGLLRGDLQQAELRKPQDIEEAKSSKYKRHKFPGLKHITALIEEGNVVEAMTRFTQAAVPSAAALNDSFMGKSSHGPVRVDPHVINTVMQYLAALAMRPPQYFRDFKQHVVDESRCWTPPQMDASTIDLAQYFTIRPQVIAIYALAAVYDVAGAHNLLPSKAAAARMLRAFARHLDFDTFREVMSLALLAANGMPAHAAQVFSTRTFDEILTHIVPRIVPVEIIESIIWSFGLYGRADLGEAVLLCWMSNASDRPALDSTTLNNPKNIKVYRRSLFSIPTADWPADARLYTALIRASSSIEDVQGSRLWLDHYRLVMHSKDVVQGPKVVTKPYLEHLYGLMNVESAAIRNKDVLGIEKGTGMELRCEAIFDIIQLMQNDKAPIDLGILGTISNFLVGTGHLSQAAISIQILLQSGKEQGIPLSVYKAILLLHRQWTIRHGRTHHSPFNGKNNRQNNFLNSPRRIFRRLFDAIQCPSVKRSPLAEKRLDAFNAALGASLSQADLPLTLAIVSTMGGFHHLPCDRHTHQTAVSWLAQLERDPDGRQLPFEKTSAISKLFVSSGMRDTDHYALANDTRQYLIREGAASEGPSVTATYNRDGSEADGHSDSLHDSVAEMWSARPYEYLLSLRKTVAAKLVQVVRNGLEAEDGRRAKLPLWAEETRKQLGVTDSNDALAQISDDTIISVTLQSVPFNSHRETLQKHRYPPAAISGRRRSRS